MTIHERRLAALKIMRIPIFHEDEQWSKQYPRAILWVDGNLEIDDYTDDNSRIEGVVWEPEENIAQAIRFIEAVSGVEHIDDWKLVSTHACAEGRYSAEVAGGRGWARRKNAAEALLCAGLIAAGETP